MFNKPRDKFHEELDKQVLSGGELKTTLILLSG